ncbi:uncharacterized protein LOC125043734 [Penaeus chinensis]|uniref:uncharacterized protein LOC125043734 n=1 Tax=Penaeus chinensis TaxID=139456 RepID=UPI001FB6F9E3|nr:uncharacterized protein LOC125043734 [Penaeus chinensis]
MKTEGKRNSLSANNGILLRPATSNGLGMNANFRLRRKFNKIIKVVIDEPTDLLSWQTTADWTRSSLLQISNVSSLSCLCSTQVPYPSLYHSYGVTSRSTC